MQCDFLLDEDLEPGTAHSKEIYFDYNASSQDDGSSRESSKQYTLNAKYLRQSGSELSSKSFYKDDSGTSGATPEDPSFLEPIHGQYSSENESMRLSKNNTQENSVEVDLPWIPNLVVSPGGASEKESTQLPYDYFELLHDSTVSGFFVADAAAESACLQQNEQNDHADGNDNHGSSDSHGGLTPTSLSTTSEYGNQDEDSYFTARGAGTDMTDEIASIESMLSTTKMETSRDKDGENNGHKAAATATEMTDTMSSGGSVLSNTTMELLRSNSRSPPPLPHQTPNTAW